MCSEKRRSAGILREHKVGGLVFWGERHDEEDILTLLKKTKGKIATISYSGWESWDIAPSAGFTWNASERGGRCSSKGWNWPAKSVRASNLVKANDRTNVSFSISRGNGEEVRALRLNEPVRLHFASRARVQPSYLKKDSTNSLVRHRMQEGGFESRLRVSLVMEMRDDAWRSTGWHCERENRK
ncbi:hypothetical protein C8J57DRAFT_1236706 [Mycena rebaudengoi]|nr:hypothetical protein C8J57DRAFT_1236706 [Mycena rebaudengoi]